MKTILSVILLATLVLASCSKEPLDPGEEGYQIKEYKKVILFDTLARAQAVNLTFYDEAGSETITVRLTDMNANNYSMFCSFTTTSYSGSSQISGTAELIYTPSDKEFYINFYGPPGEVYMSEALWEHSGDARRVLLITGKASNSPVHYPEAGKVNSFRMVPEY